MIPKCSKWEEFDKRLGTKKHRRAKLSLPAHIV
jgi:hypothetical protein